MQIEKDHLVVAAILCGLFAAFGLGVWWPEQSKMKAYSERITAAEEQLGPNFNQPVAIANRETEIEELREKVDSSSRYVPQQADLASVMRSLTEAVKLRGIDEQAFRTQEVREFKFYSEVPVELELEGGFDSVFSVLEVVETMPRLVRVDALSLRVQPSRNHFRTEPKIKASYRLSSFFTGDQGDDS